MADIEVETEPGEQPTNAEIVSSPEVAAVLSQIREEQQPVIEQEAGDSIDAVEQAVMEDGPADDTQQTEEPQSWVKSVDVERAKAYGLDENELALFPSADEFYRWASLTDRANARRPKEEAPKEVEKEPAAEDPDEMEVNGKVNPAYFEKRAEEYSAETILAMKHLRKQQDFAEKYEADQKAATERQQQQEYNKFLDEVHDALDELRPDFYGKSLDERGRPKLVSDTEGQRRERIQAQVEVLLSAYAGQGRPVPSLRELARQAEVMVFGDEVAKFENKAKANQRQTQAERLAAQQKKIRPVQGSVGAAKAYVNSPPAEDSAAAIARAPSVQAVIRQIAEQNGF